MVQTLQKQVGTDKYRMKFWLMMAIFYAMFVVRNIIGISFPIILYLVWIGVMCVTFEDHEIKALLVSFIPLYPAFQYKYAIMLCSVLYVIRFFKQRKLTLLIFPGIFLMVWELLHHNIGSFSFWTYIRSFVEFFCLMVIMCIAPKKRTDVCQLSRVLGFSSVVAFGILLLTTLQMTGMSLFELLEKGFRLGNQNEEIEGFKFIYNANGLGFLCNMTIAGILINFHHKRGNVWDAIMLAFVLFVGLLTTSRTFLIILVLTVLIYIMLQDAATWEKIGTLATIFIIITIIGLLVYFFFPDIIVNYIERFSTEDVTGGRAFLLEFYNEFIFSSVARMFFGIGMQDISGKIRLFENQYVLVPHNGYQEIIVAWGIVGFILMVFFMVSMFVHAKRRQEKKVWIHYLPLALLLINILAGQFITSFRMLFLVFLYEIIVEKKNNFGIFCEWCIIGSEVRNV